MSDGVDSLDVLFRGLAPPPPQHSASPFKFLDPYGPADRAIFFGREAEIAELYGKFFQAPLLLVYGPSGAGKTSLVQCGLRGEIPSEDLFFITVRCARDPLGSLQRKLLSQVAYPQPPSDDLETLLREAVEIKSKPLALFLDQFEELFLFQPRSVRDEFVAALRDWLDSGIKLHIIIGIREEYLAHITELEQDLPAIYENRVWVRRMGREQAREAITGPCRTWGIDIDATLVEELLDELVLSDQEIELPILQVVLDTLYRRALERAPKKPSIVKNDYLALGCVSAILGGFIQDRIEADDDPERARQVLKAMITPAGTRQLSTLDEIVTRAGQFGTSLDPDTTKAILSRLVDGRIVRPEADGKLYELRHDSLARTVLEWMSGMEKELAEVRQMLEHRLQDSRVFGDSLDENLLNHVEPYLGRLQLTGDLRDLVRRSRKTLRNRKVRLMSWGMVLLLGVLITVAIQAWKSHHNYLEAERQRVAAEQHRAVADQLRLAAEEQRLTAVKQRNEAQRYLAAALFEKAQRFFDARRYNEAAICAAEAWVRDPAQYYPGLVQDEGLLTPLVGFMQANSKVLADAVFSPDGSRLLTAHYDHRVREWDLETQTLLGVVANHTGGLRRIALADQGRVLVSADYEGIIKITRLDGSKRPRILAGHEDHKIFSMALDRDGSRIVSGDEVGTIQLWGMDQGDRLLEQPLDISAEVMAAAFTPDGTHLVTASATNGPLTLWQPETGQRDDLMESLSSSIWDLAITPDGRYLITADRGGEIATWDLQSGQKQTHWSDPSTEFWTIAHLPDRQWNATGERQGRLKIWTGDPVKTPVKLSDIRAHPTGIRRVVWSPATDTLATVGSGGQIKLWLPSPETDFPPWNGHQSGITDMDLSPDGRYLVTAGLRGVIRKWDAFNGSLIGEYEAPGRPKIAKVAFRPGTHQIAYIHGTTFSLIDEEWRPVFDYIMDNKTTIQPSIVFTHDGGKVLLPLQVNRFNLLNLTTGKVEREFAGHEQDLYTLAISDQDDIVASGAGDRVVRLWSLDDGRELPGKKLPHERQLRSMDIRNGMLVTGTEHGQITFWKLDGHQKQQQITAFPGQINALRLSADGRLVAAGNDNGVVGLWETRSSRLLTTLHGHDGGISALRFSSDGGTLYSTGKGGKMRKWDIQQVLSGSPQDYLQRMRRLTGLKSTGIDVVPLDPDEWRALAPRRSSPKSP